MYDDISGIVKNVQKTIKKYCVIFPLKLSINRERKAKGNNCSGSQTALRTGSILWASHLPNTGNTLCDVA